MATYKTLMTTAGLALDAAAAATGTPIQLTQMAVGDGAGNPTTPSESQTTLVREVYRSTVNAIAQDADDPTKYTAELVVTADAGGFTIREAGLFDSNGTLFAVANTPAVYKPQMSDGAFGDTVVRMVFKTVNADTVSLVVDPSISIATRTWVVNYAVPANVIPGGLTNQVLAKQSNTDGDVEWVDPTAAVSVDVSTVEERQILAAGQTVVALTIVTTNGIGVYIEGARLRGDEFAIDSDTQITLAESYPEGSHIVLVQNDQTGMTQLLTRSNNLSDVADAAASRANLGVPGAITSALSWKVKAAGSTLASGDRIIIDNGAGACTYILPGIPADGDTIEFRQGNSPLSVNKVTFARNGKTIMGLSEDMTVTTDNACGSLVWRAALNTWRVYQNAVAGE